MTGNIHFGNLSKKDFPHVTLEDGKWVEAHKMILAASAWQKQASADIYEGNSEQGSRLMENLLKCLGKVLITQIQCDSCHEHVRIHKCAICCNFSQFCVGLFTALSVLPI